MAAKQSAVRGGFLVILGFVFVGIGASLYYGELGVGSLTKSGVGQQSNPLAFLPIGLGVILMIAGFALAVVDRRAS
jgi:hypothetical protein